MLILAGLILAVLAVWVVLGVGVAVIVGRGIRLADRRDRR